MKIVVIGGGAGGSTAAQFARKTDRKADIKVFEKGTIPQYSKCALPFVLSGALNASSIIEFSEEWFTHANIDLCLDTEVFSVNYDEKVVVTSDGVEDYDALIISTGAAPASPFEFKGKIFPFRTLDDVHALKKEVKRGEKAVVVGGGLIGLEAAEALSKRGVDVGVVELMPEILPGMLDADMAHGVRKKIEKHIAVTLNEKVTEITGATNIEVVTSHNTITCDFVIIAMGNTPNVSLAESKCDIKKAIVVNEQCMTSIPSVYACGDCTQYIDICGNEAVVGLGSVAVRQGMVAGTNAAGGTARLPPLLNARTTKLFGEEIAAVGPLEKELPFKPVIGRFKGSTHPDYYPGEEIMVKVVGNHEGKLRAAQAIGPGAAQKINTFALALSAGMTFENFTKIETAYAPPVAPVMDASTVACEIAERKRR